MAFAFPSLLGLIFAARALEQAHFPALASASCFAQGSLPFASFSCVSFPDPALLSFHPSILPPRMRAMLLQEGNVKANTGSEVIV